ncbi:E3 SUMO-protein ligase PIAS2-like isoform X1 [Rhineura floridana]|uniref:E3 SUMO-protein ligase PIAS2-like isoform X1 n=1 Tax=Rhineura floridana TaxID=261503 RepID=UPI002AC868C1|nr:E3 SUMO-protein ligase PIAS2-like isoform X1 [Rhineura floridana]
MLLPLTNMVSSFRVSELQVLLGFAGRNKSGRKHDLLMRALHLLKSGCSPAVQIKIRELYRRRYPRTIEGLSDLSTVKPSVFSLDSSSSPVEPDLAAAGLHPLPSTSVAPQSPSSPLSSVLLQDTKPRFEMQQPSPPVPPVHPDVQLKSLPFYDVLDVLIKPTSLVQSSIQRFQEKFFIFALTPQQVREICISQDFLPGGRRDYTVQVQLRLFMEILNECLDVDEIKFQEDGSWCPMRPKKEALKVVSPQCTKIERGRRVVIRGLVSQRNLNVSDSSIGKTPFLPSEAISILKPHDSLQRLFHGLISIIS